jgi:hypothetical protein
VRWSMRSVMPRLRIRVRKDSQWCGHPADTLAVECYVIEVASRTRTHLTRPLPIVGVAIED